MSDLTTALDAYAEALGRHGADLSALNAARGLLGGLGELSLKEAKKRAPKALSASTALGGGFDVRAGAAAAAVETFIALAKTLGAKAATVKEADDLVALLAVASETPTGVLRDALAADVAARAEKAAGKPAGKPAGRAKAKAPAKKAPAG
ncbi:MAG: hypothetical protein AAFR16_14490 [Pseudomonadota bacterium]